MVDRFWEEIKQSGKCRLTLQEGTMFWGRCCNLWERASACGSCFWPENPCGRSRSSPGNGLFSAKTGLHGITGQSPTIYIKQSVTNLKSWSVLLGISGPGIYVAVAFRHIAQKYQEEHGKEPTSVI